MLNLRSHCRFLLSFRGRFSRAQYWRAFIVYCVIGVIVFLLVIVTAALSLPSGYALAFGYVFGLVYGITAVVSVLAAQVKRLHDVNRSGLWIVVWWLLAAAVVQLLRAEGYDDDVRDIAPALLQVVSVVVLGLWPGTPGPNHFGPGH